MTTAEAGLHSTPLPMAAVTLESRLAVVEQYIRELERQRPSILAGLRVEMDNIRKDYQLALQAGLAEEAKKREDLERRMQAALDALNAQMGEQTNMLRGLVTDVAKVLTSVGGILSNPRVRTLAYTLLVSLATIASIVSAWAATRFPPTPPPPQPQAPAVTVILPKEEPR